jgi:hypothetical protein
MKKKNTSSLHHLMPFFGCLKHDKEDKYLEELQKEWLVWNKKYS